MAMNIDVKQAVDLVQVFSRCGSTYTLEIFDRIIGANIDELSAEQAYDAFIAFCSAEKAAVRPKITSLLMKAMSDSDNMITYSNE